MMKYVYKTFKFFTLLTFLFSGISQYALAATLTGTFSVEGNPVSGAPVNLSGPIFDSTTTDANGLYSFNVIAGTYDLELDAGTYGVYVINGVVVGTADVVFDVIDADVDGIPAIYDHCPDTWPIRLNGVDFLPGLQSVYNNDILDSDTVQAEHWFIDGPLALNRAINVTIQGGFECGFIGSTSSSTVIESLTIGSLSGAVTIEGISIGWHGY